LEVEGEIMLTGTGLWGKIEINQSLEAAATGIRKGGWCGSKKQKHLVH